MKPKGLAILLFLPVLPLLSANVTRPALSYAKTFGGSASDQGVAIASDNAGNVYIIGQTNSTDFPVKSGFQSRIGGATLRSSTDGGATWSTTPLPEGVYSIAGSPKAPGVLYAGTSATIYKSTDSGKTWTALSSAPRAAVAALIVDSVDPTRIYAGTTAGIFISQNSGATWTASKTEWSILDLVADPVQPSTLFALLWSSDLYRSTDSGATWTALTSFPAPAIALVCDPTNPDLLYAASNSWGFSGYADPADSVLYKSMDAGNTWTKLVKMPVAISTFALAVTSSAIYAASATGVYRSQNGGITWALTTLTGSVDGVAVDPNNPQQVYASAGGIEVTSDGGSTWKKTLPVRQNVQLIRVLPGSPATAFVAAAPGQNIFVTKWSGDGTQMIYSTYLGGSFYDFATGIAVDSQGNAYVTGYTYSTDFPVTSGVFQSTTTAPYTSFLAKISPDGGTKLFSTYFGGADGDAVFAIALDNSGNPYLTGFAGSDDFPVTPGAFQSKLKDSCADTRNISPSGDAFVTKFSPDGHSLLYSTLLGGSCGDEGLGIAVDAAGNAHVAGATSSADFPVTKGAYSSKLPGAQSGFLAKLNPQGSAVAAATYIDAVNANAVVIDSRGSPHLTGCAGVQFNGSGLPSQLPPVGSFAACYGPAYLAKLDPTFSSASFLSYIGGPLGQGQSIALDKTGAIWVAGYEQPNDWMSNPFPYTAPFQINTGFGFVGQWSADGSTTLFASRVDSVSSMTLDPSGNVFLTGGPRMATKDSLFSASLVRINPAVSAPLTIDGIGRTPLGPDGIPVIDQGLAPGEVVVISGRGLGPVQPLSAAMGSSGRLASSLGGVSVLFGSVAAPLVSVQSDQIVCLAPFGILDNGATTTAVQVRSGIDVSNTVTMPVAPAAVEALAIVNQDGSFNDEDHPAAPGSIATLYVAGFGQTNPPSIDGAINGTVSVTFTAGAPDVEFDGGDNPGPLDILFAGLAPGQVAGVVQINFRVPNQPPGWYRLDVGVGPYDYQIDDIVYLNIGK